VVFCWWVAGIGKSTLLGLISGTLEPVKGHITRNPKVCAVRPYP
jgi:ABC-type polysaccharide/polyol phosphate transport system ATPase subunit